MFSHFFKFDFRVILAFTILGNVCVPWLNGTLLCLWEFLCLSNNVERFKFHHEIAQNQNRSRFPTRAGLFFGCFSGNMGLFCFRNIEFWTNILEFLIKNCWVLKLWWVNEDCLSFQRFVIWVFPLKIAGKD